MLRLLKISWILLVTVLGASAAGASLLDHDPAGAALASGVTLLAALAALLFRDDGPRSKSRGFEPHRRR